MIPNTLQTIHNITEETGYPPTPEELADVLNVSVRSLHLHLRPHKHSGNVRYDDDGRYVVSEAWREANS